MAKTNIQKYMLADFILGMAGILLWMDYISFIVTESLFFVLVMILLVVGMLVLGTIKWIMAFKVWNDG